MRDRKVEEVGRVAVVVLARDLAESDLHEGILIIDEELLVILCLLSNDQLRREVRNHLSMIVCEPVLLHILCEQLCLLCFLESSELFYVEDTFHEFFFEDVEVLDALEDVVVFALEVRVRAGSLGLLTLI